MYEKVIKCNCPAGKYKVSLELREIAASSSQLLRSQICGQSFGKVLGSRKGSWAQAHNFVLSKLHKKAQKEPPCSIDRKCGLTPSTICIEDSLAGAQGAKRDGML